MRMAANHKTHPNMKMNRSLVALSLGVILSGATALAAETPYQFIKEIPIGGKAQWDYLKVDSEAHRLYLSHGTKVEVIDLDNGAIIGSSAPTAKTGPLPLPRKPLRTS